jgi:methionyl-tRNA formyltransferase
MIVIAGKNNIAVHGLELALGHCAPRDIAVVCNRDDNGVDTWQRSLSKAALQHGVKRITLDEAYLLESGVFLSLEFDRIVVPDRFTHSRPYNLHFSRLPEYKGMYTSVWPILNGQAQAGVTLHEIDAGIDTGAIVCQALFDVPARWNSRDLYFAFNRHAARLLDQWLPRLLSGCVPATAQSADRSSYYGPGSIDYRQLKLDTRTTAWQYTRQVQAFAFREYQFLRWNGQSITQAVILPQTSRQPPGTELQACEHSVDVATIDYDVRLHFDRLPQMLEACRAADISQVVRLAPHIAGFDDANAQGWTALIVASYAGAHDVVDWLIQQGADLDRPNHNGTTPLMYAKNAFVEGRCERTFGLLRRAGADLQRADYSGRRLADYLLPAQRQALQV